MNKIAAQKRNLKDSTANAYCHALSLLLNAANKPWQELTITDADDYLTAKRPSVKNTSKAANRIKFDLDIA